MSPFSIMAKAVEVFGSGDAANEWLFRPAMGLGWQRPVDLIETPEGQTLLWTFLGRLEYGVYT